MSEKKKLPDTVYKELLADTRETIETVKKLKSEKEDVQVFAVDAFLQLSNQAAALAKDLGEKLERNPLSRRMRMDEKQI